MCRLTASHITLGEQQARTPPDALLLLPQTQRPNERTNERANVLACVFIFACAETDRPHDTISIVVSFALELLMKFFGGAVRRRSHRTRIAFISVFIFASAMAARS